MQEVVVCVKRKRSDEPLEAILIESNSKKAALASVLDSLAAMHVKPGPLTSEYQAKLTESLQAGVNAVPPHPSSRRIFKLLNTTPSKVLSEDFISKVKSSRIDAASSLLKKKQEQSERQKKERNERIERNRGLLSNDEFRVVEIERSKLKTNAIVASRGDSESTGAGAAARETTNTATNTTTSTMMMVDGNSSSSDSSAAVSSIMCNGEVMIRKVTSTDAEDEDWVYDHYVQIEEPTTPQEFRYHAIMDPSELERWVYGDDDFEEDDRNYEEDIDENDEDHPDNDYPDEEDEWSENDRRYNEDGSDDDLSDDSMDQDLVWRSSKKSDYEAYEDFYPSDD